jgi:hypothetical protein
MPKAARVKTHRATHSSRCVQNVNDQSSFRATEGGQAFYSSGTIGTLYGTIGTLLISLTNSFIGLSNHWHLLLWPRGDGEGSEVELVSGVRLSILANVDGGA